MNRRCIIPVMCCVSLIMTCLVACVPTQSAAPQTQPVPVVSAPKPPAAQDLPKPPAAQENRKILFQDDFKNPQGGWRVFTNDFGEGKYENGSFTLRSTRASYPKYEAYTTNPGIPPLTSFVLDMDVTMLDGSTRDQLGILLKWPDINPLGIEGYEQPSDYYFVLAPAGMYTWAYTKQTVKGSSVDKVSPPGDFLFAKEYTCVKGIKAVNNIKISFNPAIRYLVNDYELVADASDESLDYVNRLIKDKTMDGAVLQIFANSQKEFSSPVFQLNKIAIYSDK
jgi:hypothetical protein